MTWGGIKKGDRVLAVYDHGMMAERVVPCTATSVGRKWIGTHAHGKFCADTGYGEYGWSLHTDATLDEKRRRDAALRTLGKPSAITRLPLEVLEQIAAIVTTHAKAAS